MRTPSGATLLLVWMGAACATSQHPVHPAGDSSPRPAALSDDIERQYQADAARHAGLADAARESGNLDLARTEDGAAAEGYAGFAERFSGSPWRFIALRSAAERFLLAGAPQKAVEQTQKILVDPQCDPSLKAVAHLLAASGWQAIALAETDAGKIEKLSLLTVAQRQGQPLNLRSPAEPWKRFVEAVDAYLPLAGQGLDRQQSQSDRRTAGVASAADLALAAAQVTYAHDDLEEARRRLDGIVTDWPSNAAVMENAVPLYLQTFLVLRDDTGYDAAVARVRELLAPEVKKARSAANSKGATDGQKRAAEVLSRLDNQLAEQQQGTGFTEGERLLSSGKYLEAAESFERFAAQRREHADAPSALFNAAIARDRANEPKRAMALREQLLRDYADSKVAQRAAVAQASAFSRMGDHREAQKLYGEYLTRWPKGEQRCLALYNRAVELSATGSTLEAADTLVVFGSDDRCAREDPRTAAGALYNAAGVYQKARKKDRLKSALKAMLGLPSVTDTVVRSWIVDARRRLEAMK